MSRHVLILAAGQGTRMRSSRPKVLHRLAGLPLITHVLRAAEILNPKSIGVVVGHVADQVRGALGNHPALNFVLQSEQLGTGHALLQAESLFRDRRGSVVVLSGDVPLIRSETLRRLVETHERMEAAATVLTARMDCPLGYGRIIRNGTRLSRIVEERDASKEQRQLKEINGGIYVFTLPPLFDALRKIPAAYGINEIYLPELVTIYGRLGLPVETVAVKNPEEVRGINSQTELAEVRQIVRNDKNEELMAAGVTVEDPATTYVDTDVEVGADTIIHPGVILEGRTTIGVGCELHAGVRIVDSTLGDNVLINNHCVIQGATIATDSRIGPFAHLRPETVIGESVRIGNFVETKKVSLGNKSKAGHLSYLGDAMIGSEVNIGAGTITCNYDGSKKHPTTIGDHVFIGSGAELIAPVNIGDNAYVAAGSCVTEDVPKGALGVARGRQINKENWVSQRKEGEETPLSEL